MKTFLSLLFLLSIALSCQKQSKTPNRYRPDVSVQKLQLKNPVNVKKVFGADVMQNLLGYTKPKVSILSSDQKQRFTVYYNPKNDSLTFSQFEVKYNHTLDEVTPISSFPKFETESGIELGISTEKLVEIKGEPDKTFTDVTIQYTYSIDKSKSTKFLNYFKENQYTAVYTFLDNRLIEFSFGFEK